MDEAQSEPATPRRWARAREQGVVAHSPLLSAAAALLACVAALGYTGARFFAALERLVRSALNAAARPDTSIGTVLAAPLRELCLLSAGVLLAVALACALVGFLQVGPLFAARALAPDPRRLDPLARLRAWLSGERLQAFAISALALCTLALLVGYTLLSEARGLLALGRADPDHARRALLGLGRALALRSGLCLALLGAFDLVLRRLQLAQTLRMSRRELVREQREQYGVPEQRERRRRAYAEAHAQAELSALERVSVLLVDPVRGRVLGLQFARDDPAQSAPRVVLKAQAALALRVQTRAALLSVPSCDEPGLCARLFPLELCEAVPRAEYDELVRVFRSLPERTP